MSDQVTLANGDVVRLGRIKPLKVIDANGYRITVLQDGSQHVAPLFGAHFARARMAVQPPEVVDYASKAMPSLKRMYLNDRMGCCVISGKVHQLGLWSGNDSDSGGVVLATDQEIQEQYRGICGPGDNGCNIAAVLDVFKRRGLQASGKLYRIDGYVAVDWTNKLQVQVAILLFGSLTLGINLPSSWTQGGDGSTWDVTDSPITGGHDVCCTGYNHQGVVISTWGGLRTITWNAFLSRRWLEECFVELAPLWYGSDKLAPCGVDVVTLKADLEALGGGRTPPVPDPSPVPPVPTPPIPPVPPVPIPVEPQQLFTLTLPRGVPRGGRVTFNTPQALAPGKYGWTKLSGWGVTPLPVEETYEAVPEVESYSFSSEGVTITPVNLPRRASMLQPLVTEFPSEAVGILLPLLRGQAPSNNRLAATAGENIISYAINLGFPAQQMGVPMGTNDTVISAAAVADHLEHASRTYQSGNYAWGNLPWRQIVQTLLPLIIQWMAGGDK